MSSCIDTGATTTPAAQGLIFMAKLDSWLHWCGFLAIAHGVARLAMVLVLALFQLRQVERGQLCL